ncbi:cytochrome c oxidase subunit 3 family protein [Thalassoroseus pseudoceratinae]|uniref:hypothetical protein n=1 Tax=Thalassoroseus pseudoceratinae TaxID=2713176 RepID=UPI00141F6DC1|nr:hypothetical protein [Thalassoroseus pseudoceratinae]
MDTSSTTQPRRTASGFAVRLFQTIVVVYLLVFSLTWGLTKIFPIDAKTVVNADQRIHLPLAFWISTALLVWTSVLLIQAQGFVQREKQRPFRKRMLGAVCAGALFVSIQSYALWWLLAQQERTAEAVTTGSRAFVFVLAFLHAMHVSVALLFLLYVTLKSLDDRYDHEYYWGVTACGGFWHVLGAAWMAILMVFLIAL